MGGQTLRPNATGWRSGQDSQQHAPDNRRAVCGQPIREERYDRPDWPRCVDCIAVVGIDVRRPAAAPGETMELWGK